MRWCGSVESRTRPSVFRLFPNKKTYENFYKDNLPFDDVALGRVCVGRSDTGSGPGGDIDAAADVATEQHAICCHTSSSSNPSTAANPGQHGCGCNLGDDRHQPIYRHCGKCTAASHGDQ